MPLHTLSAAPVASPKRGVLWCVYVYWIYKEEILHPLQNRLCSAPVPWQLFQGSSGFHFCGRLSLDTCLVPWNPISFALLISSLDMLQTWTRLFPSRACVIFFFFWIFSIPLKSHTSFNSSSLTYSYHICDCSNGSSTWSFVLTTRPAWCKKAYHHVFGGIEFLDKH